jgi:hypothetical protein
MVRFSRTRLADPASREKVEIRGLLTDCSQVERAPPRSPVLQYGAIGSCGTIVCAPHSR